MRKYIVIFAALAALVWMFGCAAKEEASEAEYAYEEYAAEEYYDEAPAGDADYGMAEKGKLAEPSDTVTGYETAGGEIPAAPETGEEITFAELDTTEMTKDLMVIKTADVTYEVEDVDKATDEVVTVVSKYNAFILDSHKYKDEYGFTYSTVTVRIKPEYFEKAIKDLHEGVEGDLINEQITGEDVTAEYVDLKARLDNKLEVQRRFNEYLDTQTRSLDDIITVERELERIGEDVERLKGQLRYLENRVALSTITVNVQEPSAPTIPGGKRTFWEDIKWAFRVMFGVIVFLIQAFIILLPFIVIVAVAFIVIRAIVVHYVRKSKAASKSKK
ncbi:MAG: DUF4349 domain-containing protein [Candidatus Coatesbacteria bacterium]|nr:MAG: DUF4349 domain-containing protein [Candidatus Coatesbacteria bacterium]